MCTRSCGLENWLCFPMEGDLPFGRIWVLLTGSDLRNG